MHPGFVGTFFSHTFSLMSSMWALKDLEGAKLRGNELVWLRVALLFTIMNSIMGLIRYGSSTHGYKLKKMHIFTLNVSTIISFSIVEMVLHSRLRSPRLLGYTPLANLLSFVCNLFNNDYRTKSHASDGFIGVNCVIASIMAYFHENYYAIALTFTYMFGYYVVGDCGFVFDSELPAVDAYQYLTCFINAFIVYTFAG